MLSYTYHFYNQTDIYFLMKFAIRWGNSGFRLCPYRRSFQSIRKWGLVAKLNLVEAIK